MNFDASYSEALNRLARFTPKAGRDYAAQRNYDRPGHGSVSTLSPYIRHRLLSEAEVLRAILGRHSPAAAEKFVQEVFWRSYWKGWLELRPEVWTAYQADLKRAIDDVQTQSGLRAEFEAACLGQTDIDCFNNWSHELVNTDYIHNHARMWFASIWIHSLQLPWQLGADFFLRHLLDGDPASNTLSWRWVAGLHTVGKTYLARPSNIEKYTEGRFTPQPGSLAGAALSLPPEPRPAPRPCPDGDLLALTPETGLLLHDDDLSPGYLFDAGLRPVATICVNSAQHRSALAVGDLPVTFATEALKNTCARYRDRLGSVTTPKPDQDLLPAILDWARTDKLKQIVTPYAPVGPNSALLDKLEAQLQPHNIALNRIMRDYDKAAWPHATAGFFKFKTHIPNLLSRL